MPLLRAKYGPELVPNGTFDTESEWTAARCTYDVTTNAGKGTVTQTEGSDSYLHDGLAATLVNKKYELLASYYGTLSSGVTVVRLMLGESYGTGSIIDHSMANPAADETYRKVFVATATVLYVSLWAAGAINDVHVWDNISVRLLYPRVLGR